MGAPPRSFGPVSAALACAAVFWGCANALPLEDRSWSRVRTEHFDVASAFDSATTLQIAADLERFRMAAEYLWGESIPSPPRPTRVVAYHGHMGPDWAFYLPSVDSSYLIASPQGDWVVLRGSDVENGAFPVELKLSLARRLYWNARTEPLPPWYVEGLAQLASTTRLREAEVEVGVVRSDQLERLRTSHWVPLPRVMATGDLENWSQRERELFDAESWAVAHYLRSSRAERDRAAREPDLLSATVGARDGRETAGRRLGEALSSEVARHVQQAEFESLLIRLQALPPAGPVEALPLAEAHLVAGELSLDIAHRPAVPWNSLLDAVVFPFWLIGEAFREPPDPPYREEQARAHLERAREEAPDSGLVLANLALAQARLGEVEQAVALCDEARARAAGNPATQRRLGDAWRALAQRAAEGQPKQALLDEAAAAYERALASAPDEPAALYGLAAVRLDAGDADGAVQALSRLQRWLPGDPQVLQLSARVELARGERGAARLWATRALTTARHGAEVSAAQTVLEQIDAQVARH